MAPSCWLVGWRSLPMHSIAGSMAMHNCNATHKCQASIEKRYINIIINYFICSISSTPCSVCHSYPLTTIKQRFYAFLAPLSRNSNFHSYKDWAATSNKSLGKQSLSSMSCCNACQLQCRGEMQLWRCELHYYMESTTSPFDFFM